MLVEWYLPLQHLAWFKFIFMNTLFNNLRKNIQFRFEQFYDKWYWLLCIHGLVSSSNVKQKINTNASVYVEFDNYLGTFVSKCSPTSKTDILWQFRGKEEWKLPATELELADNEFIKDWFSEKISGWDNPFIELLNNS